MGDAAGRAPAERRLRQAHGPGRGREVAVRREHRERPQERPVSYRLGRFHIESF